MMKAVKNHLKVLNVMKNVKDSEFSFESNLNAAFVTKSENTLILFDFT